MKVKTKKIIMIGLGVAIVAAVGIPTVLKGKESGDSSAPKVAAETSVYSVNLQKVISGKLQTYLELTGDVTAETNVDIYPDVNGKLVAVRAKVGDRVTRGLTVIAEIDPSHPGSTYSISPVYSPLTGTVTSVTAQLGATVNPSTSLGTVGVLGKLLIDVQVPETSIAGLRLGLKADVSFAAYPGQKFSAEIDRLSPVVDVVSRTKKIRLRFLSDDSRINAGMFAQVKLLYDASEKHVIISQAAILPQSGKTVVFVSDGGIARRREVSPGLTSDGMTEILSGLEDGELIVTKGQELLDDSSKIRAVNAPAGGNE